MYRNWRILDLSHVYGQGERFKKHPQDHLRKALAHLAHT